MAHLQNNFQGYETKVVIFSTVCYYGKMPHVSHFQEAFNAGFFSKQVNSIIKVIKNRLSDYRNETTVFQLEFD